MGQGGIREDEGRKDQRGDHGDPLHHDRRQYREIPLGCGSAGGDKEDAGCGRYFQPVLQRGDPHRHRAEKGRGRGELCEPA